MASDYGKWSEAGVPHRGWVCTDMIDLEEPTERCQMCEKEIIRYVHVMSHDDYGTLRVGCVCAENMSEDVVNPKRRQAELQNAAAKKLREAKQRLADQERLQALRAHQRARFIKNPWKRSKLGNEYWSGDAAHVVIFPKPSGWSFTITHQTGVKEGVKVFAPRPFVDKDDAKAAAFDIIYGS